MKKRSGFVSNSSSSSFTCPICDETGDTEYDDIVSCNGCDSIFCYTCKDANNLVEHCPVCKLETVSDYDMITYLLKSRSLDRKLIVEEMRAHGNLTNLRKWLRSKE